MGLAPYGEPRYTDAVRRLVRSREGGDYALDLGFFDFVQGQRMGSSALWELFGGPPRGPGEEITRRHRDIACSVQRVLEEILLEKARYLHHRVPSRHLCLAGGVALNCVAVGRIVREGPFAEVFVQPAAGDAGAALGAAALAGWELGPRIAELSPALRPASDPKPTTAPEPTDRGAAAGPRPISIWQPRRDEDGTMWARPPVGPLGDHYATTPVLRPKAGPSPVRIA